MGQEGGGEWMDGRSFVSRSAKGGKYCPRSLPEPASSIFPGYLHRPLADMLTRERKTKQGVSHATLPFRVSRPGRDLSIKTAWHHCMGY